MDFSTLFPAAAHWVESLPGVWPFSALQDVYAPFGALHLAGLGLMGGCIILLNLRLLGAGLIELPASRLERSLRPWLILGVAVVLGTGVIIGALNSAKLYYSPAFFTKMVAMAAGLVFTFGVTTSVAKTEGKVSGSAKIAATIAALLWLFSMGVFAVTDGVNPGMFHLVTAGYALLAAFAQRTRLISLLIFGALVLGTIAMYAAVGFDNMGQLYLDISSWALSVSSLLLVVLLGYEISAGSAEPGTRLARLIALFSVLAWVTVAAGGRWIGFS
jgi:hypothetical protein